MSAEANGIVDSNCRYGQGQGEDHRHEQRDKIADEQHDHFENG